MNALTAVLVTFACISGVLMMVSERGLVHVFGVASLVFMCAAALLAFSE